ncbi:response regulator [Sporosarcina sp. 179-K 3D1 HS]|uniref:response regulator transcription factor n=1 Tax=Sporosarcina sp. 179-K 3D1 HS TaxID=3232169 RepID=UPI0039A3DF90
MRILLVDDEPLELQTLEKMIKDIGDYEIHKAENGLEAIDLLQSVKMDIVFLDIKMPGMNGLEVLSKIHQHWPDTIVSIISAFDDFIYAQRAMEHGAVGYLLKPFTEDQFKKLFNKMEGLLAERNEKRAFIIQSIIERSLFSESNLSDEEAMDNLSFLPEAMFVIRCKNRNWMDQITHTQKDIKVLKSPQDINGFTLLLTLKNYAPSIIDQILLHNLNNSEQILYGLGESNSMKAAYAQAVRDYHDRNRSTFQLFLHYIKENFYKNITLTDAAKTVHVSSSHLNRLLKKEYGKTFTEILLDIRIERAKELLLKNYNVEVVSDMVGFNSAAYFAVCFKKFTGVSPSKYRSEVG